MDDLSFLKGLPFVDAFFPSGGYAYSYGLEVAAHDGAIGSGGDLERYLRRLLFDGVGRSDAVAVSCAHRALQIDEMERALEADRRLEAMKVCRELREASRQMGRQLLRIGAAQIDHPIVQAFKTLSESGETPGHHAVVIGLILSSSGWPARAAVAAFLYQTVVGWVSAGLRLFPVGQEEGQRIIHSLLADIAALAEQAEELGPGEMMSFTPLHEIRAMRHPRLEVRLFRS